MDTIKIGKFIALCRKEKEFTQKELAEHLGISDKSVSKWERGINMPDASLYYPLCELLDITINELFAGERLQEEDIIKKAEENMISIVKDNTNKSNRLTLINKIIKIGAICLVPLIVLQWNLKLVWIKLEMDNGFGSPPIADFYASLYILAILYFVAYFMVYKKIKLGYYLMWITYVVLSFIYLILIGNNPEYLFMSTSLDLWINIVLNILGIINKELEPMKLLKRSS